MDTETRAPGGAAAAAAEKVLSIEDKINACAAGMRRIEADLGGLAYAAEGGDLDDEQQDRWQALNAQHRALADERRALATSLVIARRERGRAARERDAGARQEAWSRALAAIDDAVDAAADLQRAFEATIEARNRLKAAVGAVGSHAAKAGRPGAFYHRGLTSNLVPVLETRMATCLDCGGEPPPILDMVRRAGEQAGTAEENLQWRPV